MIPFSFAPLFEHECLRAHHAPVLEKLLKPQGINIPDPAQARVGDCVSAHRRCEESCKAWTESYRNPKPRVAEVRAAETAANGPAPSHAASPFLANPDHWMYRAHAEKTPQYQQQLGELAPWQPAAPGKASLVRITPRAPLGEREAPGIFDFGRLMRLTNPPVRRAVFP